MTSGKRARHSRAVLCLIVLMTAALSFLAVAPAFAESVSEDGKEEPVRIGWYQSDMFQEGTSDDEVKSGYCYDYLQKVADYTGWEYEYVYGSWTELFHMLQNGEIDCLGGVSITDERKETMLFPDTAMGTDQYYLYKKSGDESISPTDLSTFSGKKAGTIRDNQLTVFTRQWMKEKNVDMEIVYFDSFEEQEKAFEGGEIDLLAQTVNNVLRQKGIAIAAKIGEDPFYLAVSKDETHLLNELNDSLNTILSIDPFVLQNLQYQNYGATLINRTLSDEEMEWVDKHPVITVAYMKNYLPYSDSDEEGQATGLMTDTLDAILTSLNLDRKIAIEYVAYESFDDMVEAVRTGQVDLAFPVHGNLWELEKLQIDASAAVIQGSENFVYRGKYDRNRVEIIAVNRNNQMQIAYCRKYFPEVELMYLDSIEECLEKVMRGEADGTVINTLRTELVTGNSRYKSLSYIQLEGDDSRCFGVNERNTELLLIINRGLRTIGSSFGIDSSYKYMGELFVYNLQDFVLENAIILVPLLLLLVGGTILLLIVRLYRKEALVNEKEAYIRQVNALNAELEELRKKADDANAAKTNFLFDMSHDIRTPMNAILGFSNLMEKNLEQPEILRSELKKVQSSGEYLLALINNMLEVAKIDSGKEELNEVVVDLLSPQNSVIPIFEQDAKKKNQTVTENLNIHHRYIHADLFKLKEIMINLVSNAIKYTPEGGEIHITLNEVTCEKDGFATYEYCIEDTGIGMSREFQKVIFESFARERNTTESQIAGTGLGMAIVKRLVDLMGGTIEVESEPGKGSRFTVRTTHLIEENPEAYPEESMEGSNVEKVDFTGHRFLLAEDNEMNAEISIAIIEDLGASCDWVRDGVECMEMLTGKPAGYYDLILMDIQMPNMNGYETAQKIRQLENPELAGIPIIAMTANAFEEDKRNALDAGMDAHLSKPIEISRFVQTLGRFITGLQ